MNPNSPPNPGSRTPNPGFSIIELLVAISVLSLMMTLAARIFFDAQKGVQRGIQTSQIIAESRSISQPLTKDVRSMNVFESKYGSNSPGFLIIHQAAFGGVLYPDPDDITDDTSVWTVDRDGDGIPNETANPADDDMMRSDQIGFFIDADKLESLTPGEDNRYDSDAKARHARVWIGHAFPADVTPSPAATDDQPGENGYNLASQMILGRQALMLVENDTATTYPDGLFGDGTGTGGTGRFAAGGGAVGDVQANTYLGESDVLELNSFTRSATTFSIYDDGGVDPAGGPVGLFRTPTYDEPAPTSPSWFGDAVGIGSLNGSTGLPNGTYLNRALEWLYVTPGQRLRAQTSIDSDFSAGIFSADDIAKLHASFAPHVADFAIEFAADWIDDLDPDDFDTDGNVNEPDGQPDFEPDRDGFGNIKWYTLIRPNPDVDNNGVGDFYRTEPVTYGANITVARFDGTVGTLPGPFVGGNNNPFVDLATSTITWSHTGDDQSTPVLATDPPEVEGCGKYWPYMIRFRYRLMDGRGEFRTVSIDPDFGRRPLVDDDGLNDDPGEYAVVGRWFEQVVPVPRPQGLY